NIRALSDLVGCALHDHRHWPWTSPAGPVPCARHGNRCGNQHPRRRAVWLMIIPMLLKIDLAALGQVKEHWRGIAATVGINWLVKPFSMALLGWLFIAHLFRPYLPDGQ